MKILFGPCSAAGFVSLEETENGSLFPPPLTPTAAPGKGGKGEREAGKGEGN